MRHLSIGLLLSLAVLVAAACAGTGATPSVQVPQRGALIGNPSSKGTDVFNAPYASYIESLPPTTDVAGLSAKLPAGTPVEAQKAVFTAAFITDLANDPADVTTAAATKQDLLDWSPKAPATLRGGSDDPVVSFATNAQTAYADFESRGLTDVSIVDVAASVRQAFGSVLASDPAAYQADYHQDHEPPFCIEVARQLFDQYK